MSDWPRTLSLAFAYPHHYAGVRDERSLDQRRLAVKLPYGTWEGALDLSRDILGHATC